VEEGGGLARWPHHPGASGGGWARHRLRPGHAAGGLADLAAALDVEGLPETAPETLRTVYTYLERHREPID
jgi:hypothetical protein